MLKHIGLLDADLLDGKSHFPNLALMKLSSYFKQQGHTVKLLCNYISHIPCDEIYISKVFTTTYLPPWFLKDPRVTIGGTGFFEDGGTDLPYEIEHLRPDYDLYNDYISRAYNPKQSVRLSKNLRHSIGFTTRGCFRKCDFCVNKKYDHAVKASEPEEFIDPIKKKIMLLDDNFLAYPDWASVLDKLEATGKPFQFNQGPDIRLLNEYSAERFAKAKTFGDIIFAFDHPEDAKLIEKKLAMWRSVSKKSTKLYVLCGYDSQDATDIVGVFKRLEIIAKYGCIPYLMRHERYHQSEFEGLYKTLARWCNQPNFFKKKSFREFCQTDQKQKKNQSELGSAMRYLSDFEQKYPKVAWRFFDVKYENLKQQE